MLLRAFRAINDGQEIIPAILVINDKFPITDMSIVESGYKNYVRVAIGCALEYGAYHTDFEALINIQDDEMLDVLVALLISHAYKGQNVDKDELKQYIINIADNQ